MIPAERSPLAGLLEDRDHRIGPGYSLTICLLLATPWSIVLILRKSAAFITSIAMESGYPDLLCTRLMNLTFRFLFLGCKSSRECRVGSRFSGNSRRRMQVSSTVLYSFTDSAVL